MVVARRNPWKNLEKKIGYRFRKRRLLEAALVHRSFRFENRGITMDNQRLEFLGDAVLGFVSAAHLYKVFGDRDEGEMTAFRSRMTSGKALAALAREIELGEWLQMGKGEQRSGGHKRSSNLADALEAVIGAAYLDGGLRAVQKVFKTLFHPLLDGLSDDVWAENPKGKLQEYAQRRWKAGPKYRIVRKDGPPHASTFTVEVSVREHVYGTGKGRNKQAAETHAAEKALKHLQGGGRRRRRS